MIYQSLWTVQNFYVLRIAAVETHFLEDTGRGWRFEARYHVGVDIGVVVVVVVERLVVENLSLGQER